MCSRESEIKDGLEDLIYDILSDACPLMSTESINKEVKSRIKHAYSCISSQLDALTDEYIYLEKENDRAAVTIKDLNDEIKDWRFTLEERENLIERLEEKIEDLELQISNPTQWLGNKFGI